MPKRATVKRTSKNGEFALREDNGTTSVHQAGQHTPKVVRQVIANHRKALKRMADR